MSSMLRDLPEQTTSQLDFLDGLADKINAHRAYLRQQVAAHGAGAGHLLGAAWAR